MTSRSLYCLPQPCTIMILWSVSNRLQNPQRWHPHSLELTASEPHGQFLTTLSKFKACLDLGSQETQRDALWVRGRGTETTQGYHDTKELSPSWISEHPSLTAAGACFVVVLRRLTGH